MICEVRPLEPSPCLKYPQHMHPANQPGVDGDYYAPHHQQQQQHQQQEQVPGTTRPMLTEYYMPQPPMLQSAPVQYDPQAVYYSHPLISPSQALQQQQQQQQFAYMRPTLYAPSTAEPSIQDASQRAGMKRPVVAAATPHAGATFSAAAMDAERVCDVCGYPDAVLESPPCGHAFHSRCAHRWPVEACPACDVPVPQLRVLRIDMNAQIDSRSGKWTRAEEQFIDVILGEFDRNALPLANGTPVRLVLAKLLNCSTMRLSKKFQKNALGKRTFRVEKPVKGEPSLEFDRADHARRQRGFSRAEAVFRHELVEQFRRENNSDDGAHREASDLRRAVQQFWVANFLKLAVHIAQPVEGLDISDAKKRKHALLLLRNAQFDELLSWHRSPRNAPTVAPMPSAEASTGAAAGSQESYMSALQSMQEEEKSNTGAVKKMRTPEGAVGVRRFDHQAPPRPTVDPSTGAYTYGKLTPGSSSSATSPSAFVPPVGYPQLPPPPQPVFAYGSGHAAGSGYSPFAVPKEERPVALGYPTNALHHQQHQQQHLAVGYDVSDPRAPRPQLPPPNMVYQRNLPAPSHYQQQFQQSTGDENLPPGHVQGAATSSAAAGSGPTPWDELLAGMSTAEGGEQVTDPSLQAWSNLHML